MAFRSDQIPVDRGALLREAMAVQFQRVAKNGFAICAGFVMARNHVHSVQFAGFGIVA
jgi:hypothetical protein